MDAGGSGGRVTRVALANSPRYSWRSRRFDHDVSVPSARLRQSVARRTRSLPPPHVTHDVDEGIDPVLVAVPRQVQIGRASWRERVGQDGEDSGGAGTI